MRRDPPPRSSVRAPLGSSRSARMERNILELYRPDISRLLAESGAPAFRRAQILEHLLQRPDLAFAEATALPLEMRARLDELGWSTLTVQDSTSSADGATKLLLKTQDLVAVETVIMRYRDRVTACISSQVGCPVGCTFCATGALGFTRNLSPAEIVDQVRAASSVVAAEGRRLTNLVYMGMGEPLLNLRSVLDSIRVLTDPGGINMAHRAISVSTVGIPSGIRRLGQREPQVNLALSLHAADDRTRALLIPGKFRHPLSDILDAAWEHFELTKRKLLIEYVLIAGVNDSVEDAHRLAKLLRGHVVAVNLLAWNPVQASLRRDFNVGTTCEEPERHPGGKCGGTHPEPTEEGAGRTTWPHVGQRTAAGFRQPASRTISAFRSTLVSSRIETVVRQSKGATIQAACGQLAAQRRGNPAARAK